MKPKDSSEWRDDTLLNLYSEVTREEHLDPELVADYVQGEVTNPRTIGRIKLHASVCHNCARSIEVAKALFTDEQVAPEAQSIANELNRINAEAAKAAVAPVPDSEKGKPTVLLENMVLTIKQVKAWGSKKLYEVLVTGPGNYRIQLHGKTFDFALGAEDFTVTPAVALARGTEGAVPSFTFPEIGVEVRFFPGRKGPDGSLGEPHFDIEVTQ